MRRVIIVLATDPKESKAHLSPLVDTQAASCLHECFLLDTLEKASAVPDAELVVCSATGYDLDFLREVSPEWTKCVPGDDVDLHERMVYCFKQALAPSTSVLILSADAPTLPARTLELAFDALAQDGVEMVLGPCAGRGWYLIGMSSLHPEFLERPDWGDAQSIIEHAANMGLGWFMLPEWYCVRGIEDLRHLRSEVSDVSTSGYSACHTAQYLCELGEQPRVRIVHA